jgi:hypothetical protein
MEHYTHGTDLVQRLRDLRHILRNPRSRGIYRPDHSPEFTESDIKLIDSLAESYPPGSKERCYLRAWRQKLIEIRSTTLKKKTPRLISAEIDGLEFIVQSKQTNHCLSRD